MHGYCVSFNTNSSADPGSGCTAASGSQTPTNYTAGSLTTGQTYYLLIKSIDTVNNKAATTWTAFTYKFDSTVPSDPSSLVVVPASWSNGNSFSFSWTGSTDSNQSN